MQPEIDNLKKELAEHESIRDELRGQKNSFIEAENRIKSKIEEVSKLKVTVDPIEVANAREEASQIL